MKDTAARKRNRFGARVAPTRAGICTDVSTVFDASEHKFETASVYRTDAPQSEYELSVRRQLSLLFVWELSSNNRRVLTEERTGGLLNNGSGVFSDTGQSMGGGFSAIALGDLDDDGDLDAFATRGFFSSDRVWLNNAGVFTDSEQSLGVYSSLGLSLGDLDGDGDLDAFVANGYSQGNRVWLNQGGNQQGTFGIFSDSGQIVGNHTSRAVALGDLDGDGDLDAFVANDAESNRVWLNDDGQFTDSGQILGDHTSRDVSLGDVDGDGDLDAIVANANQANRVWLNNGSSGFSDSGQGLGNHNGRGVSLGDVDGDGDLDAFVANTGGQNNRIWINQNPAPSVTLSVDRPSVAEAAGAATFTATLSRPFKRAISRHSLAVLRSALE